MRLYSNDGEVLFSSRKRDVLADGVVQNLSLVAENLSGLRPDRTAKRYINVDFSRSILRFGKMSGVEFRDCNFYCTDMRYVVAKYCTFYRCNFAYTKMDASSFYGSEFFACQIIGSCANWSDFGYCGVEECTLLRSSFREANLEDAKLIDCSLKQSSFDFAKARRLSFSPPEMLLAQWGECSDKLTTELMRYDAANHPDPAAFDRWAKGGPCPYGRYSVLRAANFAQKQDAWSPGPAKPALELVKMLFREKLADSDFHKEE